MIISDSQANVLATRFAPVLPGLAHKELKAVKCSMIVGDETITWLTGAESWCFWEEVEINDDPENYYDSVFVNIKKMVLETTVGDVDAQIGNYRLKNCDMKSIEFRPIGGKERRARIVFTLTVDPEQFIDQSVVSAIHGRVAANATPISLEIGNGL